MKRTQASATSLRGPGTSIDLRIVAMALCLHNIGWGLSEKLPAPPHAKHGVRCPGILGRERKEAA